MHMHAHAHTHAHTNTHTHTQTAAVEALRKKAAPPTEDEFSVSFQKCKFGINLIAKLGHHLSSPSPVELLKGIFGYIQEFVQLNKRYEI